MSEKSFAVASVSVAIVWGTFFYPPTQHKAEQSEAATPVSAAVSVERLRADKGALLVSASRPVAIQSALKTEAVARCGFAGNGGCTPLHKLAGD